MNLMKREKIRMEISSALSERKTNLLIFQNSKQRESNNLTDYSEYTFSVSEFVLAVIKGLFVAGLFAYIFYRSLIAFVILSPVTVFVLKNEKHKYRDKRKETLTLQFRELMNSLISSLQAGYSVENAFARSYQDMTMLFTDKSYICNEIGYIVKALHNNRNIEDLLYDFGERSDVQDIKDFACVFKIAKRSGGDMPAMIRQTADVINEKIEVKRKITTIVSSKKTEQSIMNVVPFGIVLYIDASSPGFFDSLYHTPVGIFVMTGVLAVYIFAYILAEKITDIKI